MVYNMIILVDYLKELDLMIYKLEKEFIILMQAKERCNIIFVNGNQLINVINIIHMDKTLKQKFMEIS